MLKWLQKMASVGGSVARDAKFMAKVKLTEFWHGGIAARDLAATRFLTDHASLIMPPEHATTLPAYEQLVAAIQELSAKVRLPPPRIVVLRGTGGTVLNGSPAMLTRDTMLIPELTFFAADPRELRTLAAHELGHVANGDLDAAPRLIPRRAHHEEFAADAVAARITSDPDALIGFLKREVSGPSGTGESFLHPSPDARIAKLEGFATTPQHADTFTDRIRSRKVDTPPPGARNRSL